MLDPSLESEIASYVQSAREYEMLKEGERPPLDETFPQIAAMQYYQAAEILWLNGKEERAKPYLQKVFDIDPNFDLALRLIGIYPSGDSEPPEEYRAPMKPNPAGPKGSGFHRLPEPRGSQRPENQ